MTSINYVPWGAGIGVGYIKKPAVKTRQQYQAEYDQTIEQVGLCYLNGTEKHRSELAAIHQRQADLCHLLEGMR